MFQRFLCKGNNHGVDLKDFVDVSVQASGVFVYPANILQGLYYANQVCQPGREASHPADLSKVGYKSVCFPLSMCDDAHTER